MTTVRHWQPGGADELDEPLLDEELPELLELLELPLDDELDELLDEDELLLDEELLLDDELLVSQHPWP